MQNASDLAAQHWNETPLLLSERERYSEYPWLYKVAEFSDHRAQRVLEVGCGTGCDLLQFAKHGALATGVDITDVHLELARKRVGNLATVIKADARVLPFDDASFDYVYSHGVLHHCDAPQKAAAEILRVLRVGGKFNVHLYALFSESALIYHLKFGARWKEHVENSPRPVHLELYTARRFSQLFPDCSIKFSKYQCYHLKFAAPFLGWYLVGKGTKLRK